MANQNSQQYQRKLTQSKRKGNVDDATDRYFYIYLMYIYIYIIKYVYMYVWVTDTCIYMFIYIYLFICIIIGSYMGYEYRLI
jgi:hypothetical protein